MHYYSIKILVVVNANVVLTHAFFYHYQMKSVFYWL